MVARQHGVTTIEKGRPMRRDMPYYGHDFGWWGPLAGMILLLLVLTAVGLLIALLVRQGRVGRQRVQPGVGTTPPQQPWPPAPGATAATTPPVPMDALRILDERLARGDIDVADYAARRRALTGEVDAPRPSSSPEETRVDPGA
jgi:uncharacterized membrane protein